MTDDNLDMESIRRRIEKRFDERNDFAIHLAMFIIFNISFWVIWAATREWVSFPWPLIVNLGWGAGMVAHAMDFFFKTHWWEDARERAIQREVDLMRGHIKAKRDVLYVQMGQDGELVQMEGEEMQAMTQQRFNGGES